MRSEKNFDLMLHQIDPEMGRRFDAHGIAKVNEAFQLDALLNLLDNGIDKNRPFHTGNLELPAEEKIGGADSPGGVAYKDGSFVVMGGPDELMIKGGIKNVIVNDAYYGAVDRLRTAYPSVNFIRADRVNEGLREVIKKSSSGI